MTGVIGNIRKMRTVLDVPVSYTWVSGDDCLPMNHALGSKISLRFLGYINCVYCDRLTKKSFNQGYCYPCFQRLARCDSCMVKPEKCHYAEGTCREPEWGSTHCNIEHIVYLANTSSVKVGITGAQIPTRWIDQGASQAKPIARVGTRYQSGLLEILLGQYVSDKTAWQTMLKGSADPVDLAACQRELFDKCHDGITALETQFGLTEIQWLKASTTVEIEYPVLVWPTKVKAHNLDKTPEVEGVLLGIKGQYLILDTGVINIRKYGGYGIELTIYD